MNKKNKIEALVNEEDFNKKELDKLSSSQIDTLFNDHFDIEEIYSEFNTDSSYVLSKEEEIVDISTSNDRLSKAQERSLRRTGKI
jgi:hypothetical protein